MATSLLRTRRFIAFMLLLLLVCPFASDANTPFGDSTLVKKDGRWSCPSMFTGDLIIFDSDRGKKQRLPLTTLFPKREYIGNVRETTGGPSWGEDALYFVAKFDSVDYFYMRCSSGKQLLVNLYEGKLDHCDKHAAEILDQETAYLLFNLGITVDASTDTDEATSRDTLQGAVLLASEEGVSEKRKRLELLEKTDTRNAFFGSHGDYGYGRGLDQKLRETPYVDYANRGLAKLALRRLGFSPLGYPSIVFEIEKKHVALNLPERRKRVLQVRIGDTSQSVYRLLGPPDYIETAVEDNPSVAYAYRKKKWVDAWRYDFAGKSDFSVILIWDNDGKVERVEKSSRGLWRGDELFSDQAAKPVFSIDGSVNGVHLYSDHFLGQITTIGGK